MNHNNINPLNKLSKVERLVLSIVLRLATNEFSIEDVYLFEHEIKQAYPRNNHVKEKIRQTVQRLVKTGFISRINRGKYKRNF